MSEMIEWNNMDFINGNYDAPASYKEKHQIGVWNMEFILMWW
jgi:hypothetical protein